MTEKKSAMTMGPAEAAELLLSAAEEGGTAAAITVVSANAGVSHGRRMVRVLTAGGKRALGLLYFLRSALENPLDADDVHIMALLTNTIALVIAPLVE